VAPINKGQKVYALLREALVKTGKIGLAKVVIATKQHLAALVPSGPALVLNLLRWGDEVKSIDNLDLPAAGSKAPGFSAAEMKMADPAHQRDVGRSGTRTTSRTSSSTR
jgi:DNA end-binding protein Ku